MAIHIDFKKIFSAIKDFASHFFSNIAHGDTAAASQVELTAQNAVTLVNNIKAYIESPMGDFITTVIPGTWDDDLKAKAKIFLDKVISQEATLLDCLHLPTLGEQITCIYSKIVNLNDDSQSNSFWHKLGVLATEVFADGTLNFSDAVLAAEFVYRIIFKKDTTITA